VSSRPTLWLQASAPTDAPPAPAEGQGCGLCNGSGQGPSACAPEGIERVRDPVLRGEPAMIERVLGILRQVIDTGSGQDMLSAGLLRSLQADAHEVDVDLVKVGCVVDALSTDDTFRALRAALPDCDIYVRHSAAQLWRPAVGGAPVPRAA
jgi:metal-sulfur cluster biosynthetic enzyme